MRKGFTLIELLVVIGISAFLGTLALVYNGQGRTEVALSVEAAKISQLTLQAKQLAIATSVNNGTLVCGYGMYFDLANSQYSLFIYSPQNKPKGQCPTLSSVAAGTFNTKDIVEYSSETWHVKVAQGLKLLNNTSNFPSAVAVIFYPPNPDVLISNVNDGSKFGNKTSYVNVAVSGGGDERNIAITPAGQVSF